MTTVSLVLPVANQEDHIERIVEAHLDALRDLGLGVEFLLAVNNSRDGSLDACRRLAATRPEVVVLTTDPGWGNAVVGGLALSRGDVVGFANSARTHTVDLVRAVSLALDNPRALVKGQRVNRAYPLSRRVGSRLFNLECRALFRLGVPDINGNPKIWHRETLAPELLTEPGSFLDAEVLIRARERGVPVLEIPLTRMERHGGTSMTTLRLAMSLYTRPVGARLGRRPRRSSPPVAVVAAKTS